MVQSEKEKGKRKYVTRSATQKVLGSAMVTNAIQTQRRRQQRSQGLTQEEPAVDPLPIEESNSIKGWFKVCSKAKERVGRQKREEEG